MWMKIVDLRLNYLNLLKFGHVALWSPQPLCKLLEQKHNWRQRGVAKHKSKIAVCFPAHNKRANERQYATETRISNLENIVNSAICAQCTLILLASLLAVVIWFYLIRVICFETNSIWQVSLLEKPAKLELPYHRTKAYNAGSLDQIECLLTIITLWFLLDLFATSFLFWS